MSEGNAEIVRGVYDSINRGDVDGALAPAADDFRMDWSNSIGPARGVYEGREQARALWSSFVDAFDAIRWEPEEIIEVDESRLIVVNHVRMRGRESGVEVDARGAQLWTISDGIARSVKLYQSKDEALEAVGVSG